MSTMSTEHTNTTPPPTSPSHSTAPDTFPHAHHTSTPSYHTGDLLHGRITVIKDLGPIPIVPLAYFNSTVLPSKVWAVVQI